MTPGGDVFTRAARYAARRLRKGLRDAGLGPGLSRVAARHLIEASVLFDADWYRATYADLGKWSRDPLGHYLDRGFLLGHNPSPLFWTAWYMDRHPAARDHGGGPLAHYLQRLGTNPNPVFDDTWYEARTITNEAAALDHYVRTGAGEGADPHPLFMTAAYAAANDLAGAWRGNPLAHFLDLGGLLSLSPGPHFDTPSYLARYPDVAESGQNPLVHYLTGGARDLRDPSPDFSTLRYLRRSADARRSSQNPLVHAVSHKAVHEPAIDAGSLGLPPPLSLSVIVPNFNHAPYLRERLDSIFVQTVSPDEIIFLDDASTDGSLAIAQDYAARSPIPMHIVANARNGGSVFRQWQKGIERAKGDLIWIAESDDRCAADLIARLKPALADPAVTLSYGQSRPIGSAGTVMAADYRFYTDDLSVERWRAPYVVDGIDEVVAALAYKNTIPNASAVIFRREAALDVLDELNSFRLCGDWRLYLHLAARGRVAFSPMVVNDHRRHANALTLTSMRELFPLAEAIRIRLGRLNDFNAPVGTALASLAGIAAEYHGRAGLDALPLVERPDFAEQIAAVRAMIAARIPALGTTLAIIESPDDAASLPAVVAHFLTATKAAFVVLVRPMAATPPWQGTIAPALWLEGSAVLNSWSGAAIWQGYDAAADPVRAAILGTLAQIHGLHAIVAQGRDAARLAAAIADRTGLALVPA